MISPCRVYGIMARSAPVCVLFRRGPSDWTQLVLWWTDTDVFEAGDWFHGRIYERRCDVSPDGSHLLYFAAKFNARTLENADGYTTAWTALSRPPHYTALLLWPKGDCWAGGGAFLTDTQIRINHRPEQATLHPRHVDNRFSVTPDPIAGGEDEPIHARRLERDGWRLIRAGVFPDAVCGDGLAQTSEIREKTGAVGTCLRKEFWAFDFTQPGGPYIETFTFLPTPDTPLALPQAKWAEFDQQGRLVFARAGKLFRAEYTADGLREHELIDLNVNQPPKRPSTQTDPSTP